MYGPAYLMASLRAGFLAGQRRLYGGSLVVFWWLVLLPQTAII